MDELYIGLLSGTSVDGIDAALVSFSDAIPTLLCTHEHTIPTDIRELALALVETQTNEVHKLHELDNRMGHLFAEAALELLKNSGYTASYIRAIGSHGQTIRHQPQHTFPYTIQIGDPNIIAARTGITTVADFRRRDMANGGQGAPFAPIFHAHVLADKHENRAIVNLGGCSNVTVLPKNQDKPLCGFDTGPGNALIDAWIEHHQQKTYDEEGAWAEQGRIHHELLKRLLSRPFFQLPPPKSTGRDHFNVSWLNQELNALGERVAPVDVQATLTELTAKSIVNAIKSLPLNMNRIILCGSGIHNTYLMKRLRVLSDPIPINRSDDFGVSADWLEAMLFAWLAQQALHKRAVDLTQITGASKPSVLGGIYW